MMIDDPQTVAELTAQFNGYEQALNANDVSALDGFFWRSPLAVRIGAGESLFGYEAIASFRAARRPPGARRLRATQITSFGAAHGVTVTEFEREGETRIGRQTQVWVKFDDLGWKIVSAHVSWSQN